MKKLMVILVLLLSFLVVNADVPQTVPLTHQILLDVSDVNDWARVNDYSWYKYKDSVLLLNSLIKFNISDIPEDAEIVQAKLRYFMEDNHFPFTPITIDYCINNSWSFLSTSPSDLYNWLYDLQIGVDAAIGWREFDITDELIIQQYVGEPFFTVKFQGYPSAPRIASSASVNADLQPMITVQYEGAAALPDLVIYPSWINISMDTPGETILVSLKAKIRNNGSMAAQNVGVQFFVANRPIGSLQSVPFINPGDIAEVVIERSLIPPIPDEMTVLVSVDPSNAITELDEQNNSATLFFQIPRTHYVESFEQNFGDWEMDFDVPIDYDTGGPRDCSITRVQGQAKQGSYSVQMSIDGRSDDGTVWLTKAIPVFPESEYEIHLSFWHWRENDPDHVNTSYHVVGFIGNYPPETETDFEILDGLVLVNNANPGQGNQYPRWENYTLTRTVESGSMQYIWVGFGMTAVYETWISVLMDYVSVEVNRIEP